MGDDLYREICRCPGDDTLRLAYADWLDECGDSPATAECGDCTGRGRQKKWDEDSSAYYYTSRPCGVCHGLGHLIGPVATSNADRAEFVRGWYELQGMPAYRGIDISLDWSDPKFSPECRRAAHLRRREGELLRLHPEWSRLPCEACGGRTWGTVNLGEFAEYSACQVCSGTGDLFFTFRTDFHARAADEWGRDLAGTTDPRTVTFARGFPDSVSCTMAEAFDMHGTPTLWACDVVRRAPVTRFVLTDADPPGRDSGDKQYPFHWRDTMFTHGSGYVIADWCARNYRTLERALDAFAAASGELVRRHVYGGEVTA